MVATVVAIVTFAETSLQRETFGIREFWCLWTYFPLHNIKRLCEIHMTAAEASGNTKILCRTHSVCQVIEQKSTFYLLFLQGLFHVHKCRMVLWYWWSVPKIPPFVECTAKSIPPVDTADNINYFAITQTGFFCFNCAVSAPVEAVYGLKGIIM